MTDTCNYMTDTCNHCDNKLFPREASIPESIICYKAGREDPEVPGNRIVTEWVCPIHGVIYSPGGGLGIHPILKGGPWDGRIVCWSTGGPQRILVDGEEWEYEWDEGVSIPNGALGRRPVYVCKGKVHK